MAKKTVTPKTKKSNATVANKLKSKREAQKAQVVSQELIPATLSLPFSTGGDQAIAVPNLQSALQYTDVILDGAKASGDPNSVAEYLRQITRAQHATGLVMAKAFFSIINDWTDHYAASQGTVTAIDYLHEVTGRAGDTIRQYSLVWQFHMELGDAVPAEVKEALMLLPLGAQIKLAKHTREHGKLSTSYLKKIISKGSEKEIQIYLQELRGRTADGKPSTGISFSLEEGDVLVGTKDGTRVELGVLQRPDEIGEAADVAEQVYRSAMKRLGVNPDREPGE